jgi:hypothetical protein
MPVSSDASLNDAVTPSAYVRPTLWFSYKNVTAIAVKPHPKSACQLQRLSGGGAGANCQHSHSDRTVIVGLAMRMLCASRPQRLTRQRLLAAASEAQRSWAGHRIGP